VNSSGKYDVGMAGMPGHLNRARLGPFVMAEGITKGNALHRFTRFRVLKPKIK
jgi:hypothetical protein